MIARCPVPPPGSGMMQALLDTIPPGRTIEPGAAAEGTGNIESRERQDEAKRDEVPLSPS